MRVLYILTCLQQIPEESRKHGRRRKRKMKRSARPMRSGNAPLTRTAVMRTVPRLPSMDRCVRPSACPVKPLATGNSLPSATNLPRLVTRRVPSAALRAPGLQRVSPSMPPLPAILTAALSVTTTVTPNRLTARTRECTRKVIRQGPDSSKPAVSAGCKGPV